MVPNPVITRKLNDGFEFEEDELKSEIETSFPFIEIAINGVELRLSIDVKHKDYSHEAFNDFFVYLNNIAHMSID